MAKALAAFSVAAISIPSALAALAAALTALAVADALAAVAAAWACAAASDKSPKAATAAWERALAAPPWTGPPRWTHSDLMPSNLLVTGGRLTGVLDFATAGVGDPASDLSLAWMLLPASSHDAFRAAYAAAGNGAISAATWARGRGWALNLAIVFLAWSADNPQLHEVGERTLAAVLSPAP